MKLKVKYGLPEKVVFCSKCVISNQRPSSEVEFRHNINTNKKTIKIDDNISVKLAIKQETKKILIGTEERMNYLNY